MSNTNSIEARDQNEGAWRWLLLLLCVLNFNPIYKVGYRSKIPLILALFLVFLDFSNGDSEPYARYTNMLCNNGQGRIIAIGVKTSTFWSSDYTVQIIVCFDPTTRRTFWTKHFLGRTTSGQARPSSTWSQDFLGFDLDRIYRSMNRNNVSYPAERGHLAASADFTGDVERRATNYFINSAPQARALNRGSWRRMENMVRSLANNQSDPLLVVTGSFGRRFIFYGSNRFQYPYPEGFFKIVVFANGNMRIYVGNNDNTAACVSNFTRLIPPLRSLFGLEEADTNYQEANYQFVRVHQRVVGHDELKKK